MPSGNILIAEDSMFPLICPNVEQASTEKVTWNGPNETNFLLPIERNFKYDQITLKTDKHSCIQREVKLGLLIISEWHKGLQLQQNLSFQVLFY